VDFTHTANTSVSGSFSAVFAADERDTVMVTTSADLSISIACNNNADNYIWVANSGASDIDILISSVTHSGSPVTNIYLPADGITAVAGQVCEIGVVCNVDGAFITSRNDLKL
jgi:hypothetical protein